ncbi:TIGR01777 family oxidoreductase [Gimesia maris]|uniref:Epimerase family protein n=1 Tax=Gimesia maris TaxID=122 RepID=A0ABX5YGC6_9PLAN|nr:TIGR01777 family oxidoreductase [Gimesia maris]EDL57622.1 cell-division inhibitor [Gimesia maris DSM 8797]QEG14744.1 Epimerase family protein [Gimesia maris]QGQ31861.1 TIGR01777 family protein [Gimesia maris]
MQTTNRIVIAGGSGFLGLNLAEYLTELDYEVVLLSRNEPRRQGTWRFVRWDARSVGEWCRELEGAAAIVNLAGRTVDCIKTPDHCDEILRSRVEATEVLGKAVRNIQTPPPVWVQMSTAHRYGDPPECVCDEDSAFGYGLAPFVAREWEAAYARAVLPEMRQVILRTSFVVGRNGGALSRLSKLVRWGLGGTVGSGQQGMSWIHELDMNRLFFRAITAESMQGAYIATAPKPVSNAEFMRALRKSLKRPIGLPAANWMVRIGAPLLMRTDPELALYGRYCVSRRLREEGFEFSYSDLESALRDIYA